MNKETIIVIVVVVVLLFLCLRCKGSSSSKVISSNDASLDEFYEELLQMKSDLEADALRGQSSPPKKVPTSGTYATSYIIGEDDEKRYKASVTLAFKDIGGYYTISGYGHDVDGDTTIDVGQATYDGSAYWKERSDEGHIGMQVVTKGTFDYEKDTFSGFWLSSSKKKGTYKSFSLVPDKKASTEKTKLDSGVAPSYSAV